MKGYQKMSNRRVVDVVLSFIKSAPKSGRTYTEMLQHVMDKVYDQTYDWRHDRGVIAHCFSTIQESCKQRGNRYFYAG